MWTRSANSHTGRRLSSCRIQGRTDDSIRPRAATIPMFFPCLEGGVHRWKAEDVNALMISLDSIIATHLQLGFSVVVRDDDYKSVYGTGPHPRRVPKDTK